MIRILSPAKINLFLEIGRLESGFHRLVSLVDIVNLCDIIEIEKSACIKISFHPLMDIPTDNTVTRSTHLLKSLFNIKKGARIKVFKKIPMGSGLAGGSSNAASTLKALVKLWNISISEKKLLEIGCEISKDVPLFLYGRRCIIRGYGEKISRVTGQKKLAYFITVPPFSVSTKEVYARFDALGLKGNLTKTAEKIKLLNAGIIAGDIRKIEDNAENKLANAYFSLYREAKEVRDFLEAKTGKKVFVSGSGGSLFSVFSNRCEAEEKIHMLRIEGWKNYVVESTQTF